MSGVAALLQRLVARPSEQTERMESDPGVQGFLRETVVAECRSLGLAPSVDAVGNVVVRLGAPDAHRRLLFYGYAMTHPAGRMERPFAAEVVDGAVRGRGAAEQKGALAALLAAAGAVARQRLAGELVVAVSPAGETGRHDAAAAFLDGLGDAARADGCVVAIATGGRICLANKGRQDVMVTVRGRACHSSVPWEGLDAIAGARAVMDRLERLHLPGAHPQLGRPTLTVTSIRSWPEATHTVQDECRLVLDRRLLPGQDPAAAVEEIRRAIGDPAPWTVEVAAGPLTHPSDIAPSAPFVRLLADAYGHEAGRPPEPLYSHGAIDAGFFNARGIPAAMFGPGDQARWHTSEERVAIADVELFARVYARIALDLLAAG